MRIKKYAIDMTYNVTDAEKQEAKRALVCFNRAIKLLDVASEHLNILKTPFKDNPDIKPEEIMAVRVSMRDFRDKSVDNFNIFKKIAFRCVHIMQNFSSDTQIVKLMKSFISSIDDLESKVNEFVDLFSDLESKEFSKDIVIKIEEIQEECEDLEEMVRSRIVDHVQSNILSTSWVDSVSKDLQMKVEKHVPLIMELSKKRMDQLNESLKGKEQ